MTKRRSGTAKWILVVFSLSGLAFLGWTSTASEQTANSIFDREELVDRLGQLPPATQDPKTDDEPYLNSRGADVTAAANALMSKYGISAAQAVAQLELQSKANVASEWLREELGNDTRLGGFWIDHSRGGRLVVATTDLDLGRDFTSATSGLLTTEVKAVTVSEGHLYGLYENIVETLGTADRGTQLGVGVPYFIVSVEPQNGRVVIGQSSLAPEGMRSLATSLAADPNIFLENLGPVVFDRGGDGCPQSGCSKELGAISAAADGMRCSTGFTFSRDIGGLAYPGYLMSAGHCWADNGDYIRHGTSSSGPIMGTQYWEQDSSTIDASLINNVGGTMTHLSGNIYRPLDTSWPIHGVLSWNNISLGTVLCRTGFVSEDCGELISKTTSKNGNTRVGRLEHVTACGGDSGGPVYEPSDHDAVGLHQSSSDPDSCSSSEDSFFTFVSELQASQPSVIVDIGS